MAKVVKTICSYLDELGYKYVLEKERFPRLYRSPIALNAQKGEVAIMIEDMDRKNLDGVDSEEKLYIVILVDERSKLNIYFFPFIAKELVGIYYRDDDRVFETVRWNFTLMHNWKWLFRHISMIDLLCEYIMFKNNANDMGSWELYYDRSNNSHIIDKDGMIDIKIPDVCDAGLPDTLMWSLAFKVKCPIVNMMPSLECIKRILEYKNTIFKEIDDIKFLAENGYTQDGEGYANEFYYDERFMDFVKEFYKDKADLSDFKKLKENGLLDEILGKIQQKNRWTK